MAKAESGDLDTFPGFALDFVIDLDKSDIDKSHSLLREKGPCLASQGKWLHYEYVLSKQKHTWMCTYTQKYKHLHKGRVLKSKIPVINTEQDIKREQERVRKENLEVGCCGAFCSPDDKVTDIQLYWVAFKGHLSLLTSLKAREILPAL